MKYEIPLLEKTKIFNFKHPRWFCVYETAKTIGERKGLGRRKDVQKAVNESLKNFNFYNSGDVIGAALNYNGYRGSGKNKTEVKETPIDEFFIQEGRCLGRGLKFTGICAKHAKDRIENSKVKAKPIADSRLLIPILHLLSADEVNEDREAGICDSLYTSEFMPLRRPDLYKNTLLEVKYPSIEKAPDTKIMIIGEGIEVEGIIHIDLDNTIRYQLLKKYPNTLFIEIKSRSGCRFSLTHPGGTVKNRGGTTKTVMIKGKKRKVQKSGEDYRGYYAHEVLAAVKTIKSGIRIM